MSTYPYVGEVDDPAIPPWDGTGIPLPVGPDGIPVLPDEDRLKITSPTSGSTVESPVVVVTGNAAPGTTVELFLDDGDTTVGSAITQDDGTATFTAIPLDPGDHTLVVKTELQTSLPVSVTVGSAQVATSFTAFDFTPTTGPIGGSFTMTATVDPAGAAGAVTASVDGSAAMITGTVDGSGNVTATGNLFGVTEGAHQIGGMFVPDDTAAYSGSTTTPAQEVAVTIANVQQGQATATVTEDGLTVTVAVTGGPANEHVRFAWGDGQNGDVTSDGSGDATGTHTYQGAGTYTLIASNDSGWTDTHEVTVGVAARDLGYDPADHTVAEVQAYLSENPDQAQYVLDRERAGKARTTLIGA